VRSPSARPAANTRDANPELNYTMTGEQSLNTPEGETPRPRARGIIRVPRRHGKISRLPYAVRLELDQRLTSGHSTREVLAWLNSLPAVHRCLWRHFGGVLVDERTLSAWCRRGRSDLRQIQWLAPRAGKKRGRKSKVEWLPEQLRQQLNHRLRDGQTGSQVLAWLNSRPATRKVLREHFRGLPVNSENLSHYRHQGYSEWLAKTHVSGARMG
jgi:hypothetical protein